MSTCAFLWCCTSKRNDTINQKQIYHALFIHTLDRRICDGKHCSSKHVFFDLLHKLASICHEALNPSVVTISHTQLPFIRQEGQAVRDPEWDTSLSVRGAFDISKNIIINKVLKLNYPNSVLKYQPGVLSVFWMFCLTDSNLIEVVSYLATISKKIF